MTEPIKNEEIDTHICRGMPPSGIAIQLHNEYLRSNPTWYLFVERQATEDDLQENQHLEDIGETIWTTAVEISFCPYCGHELLKGEETPADLGRFVHMDFSGWKSQWC